MGKILTTENGEQKAQAVELDPEAKGWLLIQFHPQKGFFNHSGGEIPADQMYIHLSVLRQKIMGMMMAIEAQAQAKQAATRVQPASAMRSPFGP